MLRPDRGAERVYLHRASVDMRKQIDGLAILAKDVIQHPFSGALFAFINARCNKLKLLVWEKNGFIVWYKRLERHKFHWPRHLPDTVSLHRTMASGMSTGRSRQHTMIRP
jgi:transposase